MIPKEREELIQIQRHIQRQRETNTMRDAHTKIDTHTKIDSYTKRGTFTQKAIDADSETHIPRWVQRQSNIQSEIVRHTKEEIHSDTRHIKREIQRHIQTRDDMQRECHDRRRQFLLFLFLYFVVMYWPQLSRYQLYVERLLVTLPNDQCDQIGHFSKDLGYKLLKHFEALLSKNFAVAAFWATF